MFPFALPTEGAILLLLIFLALLFVKSLQKPGCLFGIVFFGILIAVDQCSDGNGNSKSFEKEWEETFYSCDWKNPYIYYYPTVFLDTAEVVHERLSYQSFNKYYHEGWEEGEVAGRQDYINNTPYKSYNFIGKYTALKRRAYCSGYWEGYQNANKRIVEKPTEEEAVEALLRQITEKRETPSSEK